MFTFGLALITSAVYVEGEGYVFGGFKVVMRD